MLQPDRQPKPGSTILATQPFQIKRDLMSCVYYLDPSLNDKLFGLLVLPFSL